ncbi:MAG: acyltransferase [Oscillospiraceae bacterium]
MGIKNCENIAQCNERNIGIELLRIVAMLMVVILHILGTGGIVNYSCETISLNGEIAWLLRIASFGAVNLYALTTGYVCVKAKHRLSRILELWAQVAFYSVLFTGIAFLIPQSSTGTKELVKSFLPVMTGQYWYFSAYFCLFLFIPFLNILISNLSKQQHKKLIFICFCAFCGISFIGLSMNFDAFMVNGGYSFIWLAVLYVVGAYLKLYQQDFNKYNKNRYLLIYLACICLTWLSKVLIATMEMILFNETKRPLMFVSYISPLIVLGAIALFVFFSQLNFDHGKSLILHLASVSFGVYLISEQANFRELIIKNRFADLATLPWYLMIFWVLACAVAIYLVCSFVDYLRKTLFKWLHIRSLCEKIIFGTKKAFVKILNK